MSNSNPQLKEYIREHLTNMYLELQESSKARRAEIRAKKAALGNVGGEGDLHATESGGRSGTASADDRIAKANARRAQKSTPGPAVSSPAMSAAQSRNANLMGKEVSRWKAATDVNSRMAGDFSKQRDSAEAALLKTGEDLRTTTSELGTSRAANTKLTGDLGTSNAALAKTTGDLGTSNAALGTSRAANTKLTGDLGTSNAALAKTTGDLAVRRGSERGARLQIDKLTAAANAKPMAKWTAGVKSVDSKLFGNAATPGGAASTKGLMGSGGKIGMGTKLAGAGIAAATQGLSSASTEWEENKNKGMSTGENVAKSVGRGVVAGAGAGAGAYAGMAAGAALGSAVGPVGTLVGAAIGGIAGGWGGGALADKAADMVTNIGDDDKAIKDFQGNRDIEDIERKAKTQAAKQKAEDASRVKAALPGVDYNSNDGDQVQNFRLSSGPNRGNGPNAAGGQMFVNMNQGQRRNNPR